MIFKITNKDIFEDNPELLSVEEFSKCSSRDLKYIIFVYDYKSPYRNLKIEDRKVEAALAAGFRKDKGGRLDKNTRTTINGGVKKIELAIAKYKSIQFDSDREMVSAIDNQIEQVISLANLEAKDPKQLELSIKLSEKLPVLTSIKKDLIEILELRDMDTVVSDSESDDIVNESDLSTLDIFNKD